MENVIEVRYAGVVVGRSTKVRDWGDAGAFIGFAEPLPSGTPLVLKGEGVEQPARVVEVIESADAAVAGMRVTFADVARAARRIPKATPSPSAASAAAAEPPATASVPIAAAEASPVEVSDGTSSAAVMGEGSGPATGEHEEGNAGQPGGGKRRRRRR